MINMAGSTIIVLLCLLLVSAAQELVSTTTEPAVTTDSAVTIGSAVTTDRTVTTALDTSTIAAATVTTTTNKSTAAPTTVTTTKLTTTTEATAPSTTTRVIPTAEEQCLAAGHKRRCIVPLCSVCSILLCKSKNGSRVSMGRAEEGTVCGINNYCYQGACVYKPNNGTLIPEAIYCAVKDILLSPFC